jgi:hypothetical protein
LAGRNDDGHARADQFSSQTGQPTLVVVGVALFEHEVASLNEPEGFHAFAERLELTGGVLSTLNLKPANLGNWMRWLCACCERPSGYTAE